MAVYVGGTGTANQLEDYEQGTFSPTEGGTSSSPTQSYAHQYGYYTKIGNLCFCSVDISFANSGISGGSGEANLESLPFNVANLTNNYGITASVGYSPSWGSITPTSGYAIPNQNFLKLMGGDKDTGTNFVQSSQVGNSTRLIAGFTYRTA